MRKPRLARLLRRRRISTPGVVDRRSPCLGDGSPVWHSLPCHPRHQVKEDSACRKMGSSDVGWHTQGCSEGGGASRSACRVWWCGCDRCRRPAAQRHATRGATLVALARPWRAAPERDNFISSPAINSGIWRETRGQRDITGALHLVRKARTARESTRAASANAN